MTDTTFPENTIDVVQDFVGGDPRQTPSQKLDAYRTSLTAILANALEGIQEHNPFPPHNPINAAAATRRNAILKVAAFLLSLEKVLGQLEDTATQIVAQDFDHAAQALNLVDLVASDVTTADLHEAFSPAGVSFSNFFKGPGGQPDMKEFTLPGYSGPAVNEQVLMLGHELLSGGTERTFQVGVLSAEIGFGRRDFANILQAQRTYAGLLPAAVTTTVSFPDIQLELFAKFVDSNGAAQMLPRQRFVAIRSALAYVALGDRLFRQARGLGIDARQQILAVYDAAVQLLEQSGVSPDNPRRQEAEARVNQQKAKVQAGLNYIGLRDSFVPVQKFSQLEQDASTLTAAADHSATDFKDFLAQLATEAEHRMDVQLQADQESQTLENLKLRQDDAALGVDKVDEQIRAIDDQQSALEGELTLGVLKSVVDGIATSIATKSTGVGVASSALGIASAALHFSAQSTELGHQRHIAELDRTIAENEATIAATERSMSEQRLAFYRQKLDFLQNKPLNAGFLAVVADVTEKRAEKQLDAAITLAFLFERALAFFLGEPTIEHIAFDYADRPGGIIAAAGELAADLNAVVAERDKANELGFDLFEQAISLRELYPVQFSRFLQAGEMDFEFSLYQFTKLRPASHQCRLREVGVELQGLIPSTGFSGTLTHRGRFLVRDRAATLDPQVTRLIPTDQEVAKAIDDQRNQGLAVAAIGGVLIYDLPASTRELSLNTQFVSHDPPNQGTLNAFEGHGPTGLWHLKIEDHDKLRISDVLLHFSIVSRTSDIDLLEPKVENLIRLYEAELMGGDSLDRFTGVSVHQSFPDAFFALQSGSATLQLDGTNFPDGLANLRFKAVIAQVLDQQQKAVSGVTLDMARADVGFDQVRVTQGDGFTENLDTALNPLPPDQRFPLLGTWQLRLPNVAQFAQIGDVLLFFLYAFDQL